MGDETGNVGLIRNAGATSKNNIITGSQRGFWIDGSDGSLTANRGNIGSFVITGNENDPDLGTITIGSLKSSSGNDKVLLTYDAIEL